METDDYTIQRSHYDSLGRMFKGVDSTMGLKYYLALNIFTVMNCTYV